MDENTDQRESSARDLRGPSIGHIRIVATLGQGGMGEVYKGFDEKLKRYVAVKALHAAQHLSPEAKARFAREAEILSSLEHPNICRIYELIETDDRDVLVLELIDGDNLRQAKMRGLSFSDKLRIAVDIAAVLKVTHAKQVVHRDLKPENIMLTRQGEVKILDFGLAHSLESARPVANEPTAQSPYETVRIPRARLGDSDDGAPQPQSFQTEYGVVIGTPGFLSPEQARGEPTTAASDMYSFGLLLHWLFSDTPIYAPHLRTEDIHVKAMIGKTQPVEGLPADLTRFVERLKSHTPDLRPTAVEAVDQLKWIQDKPKRRVKRVVAFAFAGVLVIGSAVSTIGFLKARAAEAKAHQEASTAKETARLLHEFLASVEPGEKGRDLQVLELLEAFRPRLEQVDKPEIQASLFHTYAHVYRSLGDYEESRACAQRAVELRRNILGEEHPDTLAAWNSLAVSLKLLGQYEKAEAIYRQCLEVNQKRYGATHPDTLSTQHNLGNVLLRRGQYAEAEGVLRGCVDARTQNLGADHPETLNSVNSLAISLHRQGRLDEAEQLYRRCLDARKTVLGPEHPETLKSMNNLAIVLEYQGDFAQAEGILRQCYDARLRVLGENHPETLSSLNDVAVALQRQKKTKQAETLHRQCLETRREIFGEAHPDTLDSMNNLAMILIDQGALTQAEALIRKCLKLRATVLGENHPKTLGSRMDLAKVLMCQNKLDDTERVLRDCWEIQKEVRGETHPATIRTLNNLAYTLNLQEKHADAAQLYQQCLDARMEVLGEAHPETLMAYGNLAYTLSLLGKHEEAESLYRQCLERNQERHGDDHPDTISAMHALAICLWHQHKEAEAERVHDACLAAARHTLGEDHAHVAAFMMERAQVLEEIGAIREAVSWYTKAAELGQTEAQAALARLSGGDASP